MKRNRIIIILLITIFYLGESKTQTSKTTLELIDSLEHALEQAITDELRIEILSHLCTKYMYVNPDTSIRYGRIAIETAKKSGNDEARLFAMGLIGEPLIYVGELPEALDLALKVVDEIDKLGLRNSEVPIIGPTLYNLSEIYFQLGKYEESKQYASQMLIFSDRIDAVGIGFGYYLMARTQVETNNLVEAAASIDSSLVYFEKVKNPELINIINGAFPGLVNTQATLYLKLGRVDEALDKYNELLNQANRNGETYHSAVTHMDISELYSNVNNRDSAINHALAGMRLSSDISYAQGRLRASQQLASLYEKSNPESALFYYKIANETQNSLYGLGNIQILRDMVEKKEAQRIELIATQEIFKQKRRQTIILIGALGLAGLAFIFYWNSRRVRAVNATLSTTLSNLRSTQAQLIQSEKMASLGELTAGIAHEIQNPLNFVNNFSDLSTELIQEANEELDKNEVKEVREILKNVGENLSKIHHHGGRASSIVKGMLDHSRTSHSEKELTDVNILCDEYVRLTFHGFKAKDKSFNVTYESNYDDKIPSIRIVPQDIGRVILNIINNAFQSVHAKQKTNTDGYTPKVTIHTSLINDLVEIRIMDNGAGIPEEIKDKIFQPFFTTKPTGQGTGLGLSLSYDIVKAHGGNLKVESEIGKGASFVIEIPAAL